jgi:allophanate hydrolase
MASYWKPGALKHRCRAQACWVTCCGRACACAGRVPAHFCGCVGVKPTVGKVSTRGVVRACRALDCISVFARTVADAATVVHIMQV